MEKRRTVSTAVQAALQALQAAFFLFTIILLTDCLARAHVNVEPNTALLNEGDPTSLLCRYERPITYCRMEITGEVKVYNLSPDWDKTPGFTYNGNGLQAGECGVTIQHVKAINNGQVKCTLGVEGEEVSGIINLVVALRPKPPMIDLITKPDREGYFHENNNFEARCIVRDGRPAANITWLLDNEPADKRFGPLEVSASPNDLGMELSTTMQAIQWRITAEDNNRQLICRSHHQTDRESIPPQEAIVQLRVRYSPISLPETIVYGLYIDHTVKVNVTIRSNPLPIIEWVIDDHVIRQGEQYERFSAFEPEYLGQDYYNVTLVIAGLSVEDTKRVYHLTASNALGKTDYLVRISSSATPPDAGLEVGAIVGIVVAVAFLIIIVLLVLFARATGRLCFAGASLNTDLGPDSEAQINPDLQNDDFDGREFPDHDDNQDEHIDTTLQTTEQPTPPVTDKLEAQKKADLKANNKTITVTTTSITNGNNNGHTKRKSVKMSPTETKNGSKQQDEQGHGQNVALLETTNGVTLLHTKDEKSPRFKTAQNGTNDVQVRYKTERNDHDDNDGSFEYGTDRESSVYNPTTIPLRPSNTSNDSGDLLNKGNQLGIPESRFSRWIPKDQREILEKQAKLLAQRIKPKIYNNANETASESAASATSASKAPFTSLKSPATMSTSTNSDTKTPQDSKPTETEI